MSAFENETTFNDMEVLIICMELSELYYKLSIPDRTTFLEYTKHEFKNIDDEYSQLVNEIFYFLECCKTGSELENYLELLGNKFDPNEIIMVVKSMIDYLNETLDYIEFNF